MRLRLWILAMLLLWLPDAYAQRRMKQMDSDKEEQEEKARDNEKKPWTEKLSFGGNIGGTFSSGYSFFMCQPTAFYSFTEKTIGGLGVTYYYWSWKYNNSTYSDNSYGFNLFGRQIIRDPLFVHLEYQPMNFNSFDRITGDRRRIWGHSLFLGAGMQQRFGNKGGAYFMFLYDVLWREGSSFYPAPYDIRIGFFF